MQLACAAHAQWDRRERGASGHREGVAHLSSADILARLKQLHPSIIDLSLSRIELLLARLGHPERRLPNVVHVAGTNGKGSVLALLRTMLEAHGRRVHVYTSPHLMRFNERIVVAGAEIADHAFAAVLEECEAANDGRPITFFEITTAAALLVFARTPADFTLLETGLGGRLDATNVVERPALTALTPIALDHQHYLGNTLESIAFEKAGIIKPGVLCLSVRQAPEAIEVICRRAEEAGAPLAWEGEAWSVCSLKNGFVFRAARALAPALTVPLRGSLPLSRAGEGWGEGGFHLNLSPPALPGAHQLTNAGLALACLCALPGIETEPEAVRRGLRNVRWPARLQRLGPGRLASLLPDGWELWLDGGHNPSAGQVLARHAAANWADLPFYLTVGMLKTKDVDGFLLSFASCVSCVMAVAIPDEENSLTAEEIAATARRIGLAAEACEDVEAALRRLRDLNRTPARVLICGSLYLAGHVLAGNV